MALPLPLNTGDDPPVLSCIVVFARDVFDFPDLPRELRDMVYKELLLDDDASQQVRTKGGLLVKLNYALFSGLLCSSKQFNAEYQTADGFADQYLQITDTEFSRDDLSSTMEDIPRTALQATKLRLNLFVYSDSVCGLECHWSWIPALTEAMPRLQTMNVRIHLTHTATGEDWQLSMERFKTLSVVDCFGDVEVYRATGMFESERHQRIWRSFHRKRKDVATKWSVEDQEFYECEKWTSGVLN